MRVFHAASSRQATVTQERRGGRKSNRSGTIIQHQKACARLPCLRYYARNSPGLIARMIVPRILIGSGLAFSG